MSSVPQPEDARAMANRILGVPLFCPPAAVAWSAPPSQAAPEWTILRGLMDRRRMRARQYACLLARQHAVDLEALGKSISPHDAEIIAGLAVDAYARRTGGGERS